jgi:glycosyltransferase involved in cell wall biosynthesis
MPIGPTIGLLIGSSAGVGGLEEHLLTVLRGAERHSFSVAMCGPKEILKHVTTRGVATIEWSARAPWDMVAAWRLAGALRRSHISLLHIHDPRAGLIGRIVARLLRIPVVYTVHVPPYLYAKPGPGGLRRSGYRAIEGFLNKRLTDKVIYVSRRVRDDAVAIGAAPSSSIVVENGIDLTKWSASVDRNAVRRGLATPTDATLVVTVGRLTPQKGIDVLLQALSETPAASGTVHAWIVGDGPEYRTLKDQVQEKNLGDRVRLLGQRADVPALLAASDIFVLPSRYEGMPLAVIEAMASGLPCIVTRIGGNPELVEDGRTGWTVAPDDSNALAERLSKLIADPALRRAMGAAGRARAQKFASSVMVERLFDVYRRLLAGRITYNELI